MSKRVLFCAPKGVPGGISQWTENILSYSTGDTDSVQLHWFYPELSQVSGVKVVSLLGRLSRGLKTYIPFVRKLRRLVSEDVFDVAHFTTSGGFSFLRDYLVLKACHTRGIKTVLHFHFGRLPDVLKQNGFERRLFDRLIKYTDRFVAIDRASYEALKSYGLENVYNLPNPLSIRIQRLIANTPDMKRAENIVLFVGHVIPTKGVYELALACARIRNVKLEIMGLYDEDVKADILNQVPEEFREYISFRGNCSFDEVIEAMKKCSVFVLPSYTEGFPNVIIESMACGCPIVATPVGAIPDMLDIAGRACGVVVPAKEVDSLKNAIEIMLSSPESETYAENARRRVVEMYSIDKIWDELKRIWLN